MKQNGERRCGKGGGGSAGRPRDLRVAKTLDLIKTAFRKLVVEQGYDELTVSALCAEARIGRKTFYTYYASLDALFEETLDELASVYLETIKQYDPPESIDEITRKFYEFSLNAGEYYNRLVCSESYQKLSVRLVDRLVSGTWMNSAWFRSLDPVERDLLLCFIHNSGLGLYRRWILAGKPVPVEQMIAHASNLLGRGVEGFRKSLASRALQ